MQFKKTTTIGGILILIYLLAGIYGFNKFEMYDNKGLIGKLSVYSVLCMVLVAISYGCITILNSENSKKVSTYFVLLLFSVIVWNFIFWGTLGNILLLNDLLNDTNKTKLIHGNLIEVNKVGDKGDHYEALVLIDSDTAQFAISKEMFELFQKKNIFHQTMQKGYFGILYK